MALDWLVLSGRRPVGVAWKRSPPGPVSSARRQWRAADRLPSRGGQAHDGTLDLTRASSYRAHRLSNLGLHDPLSLAESGESSLLWPNIDGWVSHIAKLHISSVLQNCKVRGALGVGFLHHRWLPRQSCRPFALFPTARNTCPPYGEDEQQPDSDRASAARAQLSHAAILTLLNGPPLEPFKRGNTGNDGVPRELTGRRQG